MGSSNIFINKTVSQENEIRRSSGGSWMERRLEVVVTMGDQNPLLFWTKESFV
jgi:hypothetical protein